MFLAAAGRVVADEPARFFIERIDVRNTHRVSHEVIVAESRLREGHTYSELELREAVSRVTRAPYLLSADFSLEKGSERGKYVLVITVNETKPFFYRLDLNPIVSSDAARSVELNDVTLASDNDIALGVRFFVGRRGEFHAGLEGATDNRSSTEDFTSLLVGYTQYDIFGTRAFVTLNAVRPTKESDSRSAIKPQVAAGVPLSINQTLSLEYDPIEVSSSSLRFSQKFATIRWSYNTTNHPLLPTRGTYITFAPIAVWHDRSGVDFNHTSYLLHDHSFGFETSATRWWEFADRNSVGAGVAAGAARLRETGSRPALGFSGIRIDDSRFTTWKLSVARSLWPVERIAKSGESRVELDLRIGNKIDRSAQFGEFAPGSVRQLSLSWIRRNSWGFLRLGAGIAW